MQWNALLRELGASTTEYDRFRFGLAAGFFQQMWAAKVVQDHQYGAHVRPRGEDAVNARGLDPTKTPRRWVVERWHSWLNRSRRGGGSARIPT